jgi:CelD/BcsL family acetyltransferase involved in cellulose biosynthesis
MSAVGVPRSAGYEVRVATTVEDVEDLRPAWLELRGNRVTSDPDYFLSLLESEPRIVRPHVLLIEKDGTPSGLVVGRIEERRIACRIGHKQVYAPRVRSLTVSYGGFLGQAAYEDAPVVVDRLKDALAQREADVVFSKSVPADAAVHDLAGGGSILTRQHAAGPEAHWQLELPASFDDFLASKSSRSRGRIRRYRKRLLDAHGDSLEIKVFTRPDEIDLLFAEIEAVSSKTYQHRLGIGFADSGLQRWLIALYLEHGWFRAYVLYVEGAPIAFWCGNLYNGTFQTGETGYDPAYGDLHPGTFLLMRMIEDLCEDDGARVVDYGFGDAEYKHTFGSTCFHERDLMLFGPSRRAVSVNLLRTTVLGADQLARKTLGRSGHLSRIKRWRRSTGAAGDR